MQNVFFKNCQNSIFLTGVEIPFNMYYKADKTLKWMIIGTNFNLVPLEWILEVVLRNTGNLKEYVLPYWVKNEIEKKDFFYLRTYIL